MPGWWASRLIVRAWSRCTLAKGEVPIPIVLLLFLPDTWIKDPERLRQAGVPEPFWTERSKPEIALAELRRVMQAGVSFGAVLADAGYGISGPFRQALQALGSVARWEPCAFRRSMRADVQMITPPPSRGPTPQDAGSRSGGDLGRSHAGHGLMASGDMAAWHQRPAEGEVRGRAGAGCRRASGSSARACRPASAGL